MSNTIGQFDFSIAKMSKDDTLPMDPHVQLHLKSWGTGTNGAPFFSPNLVSADEIDWQISALKADLEAVGKRAKHALTAARKSTLELVSQRVEAANAEDSQG